MRGPTLAEWGAASWVAGRVCGSFAVDAWDVFDLLNRFSLNPGMSVEPEVAFARLKERGDDWR